MMKKILITLAISVLLLTSVAALTACGNMDMIDTHYTYDEAMIKLPDGTTVTVEVEQWTDYSDSDMVQVTTVDGVVYFTHSSNVVLIDR